MSQDTSFPTRPFQQRIMRPMIPIIAIAFLVLALVIIAAVLVDARNRLTSTHLLAMNTLSREVTSDLARTIDEIIDVAISVPLRQFAVENAEPTLTSGDDISDIPGLQAITQLVDRRSDTYLSARYITRFGLPLVEFSNNEGLIQHTINTDENASDWIFDPGFQIALGSTPGRVIMGDFSLQTDSNGLPYSPSVPVINLLTPVVNPADTSETMGVLHVELLANSLLDVVNLASARQVPDAEARHLLLIDQNGQIVADSGAQDRTYLDTLATGRGTQNELYRQVNTFLAENPSNMDVGSAGNLIISSRVLTFEGAEGVVWRLIFVDSGWAVYRTSNLIAVGILIIAVLVAGATLFIIRLRLRHTFDLLGKAEAGSARLITRQLQETPPDISADGDVIEQFVSAIDTISNRFQKMLVDLENAEGRHKRELEVAAQIGRETATVYDIDQLLNRAIDLIVTEMGFSHAQVFFVDDIEKDAILVYSHGDMGRELIGIGHKISVGSDTVIGTVTGKGQSVVVNDALSDSTGPHAFNPFLPETRAELGLPLRNGTQIIGALDIQSASANAFRQDIIPIFELIADQIAIAINNARLVNQLDNRIQQINTLNRQLTRAAWDEASEQMELEGAYHYDLLNVEAGRPETVNEADELTAPIRIRGELIGKLAAAVPEDQSFTEGDELILQAVADRVALAIENARLFQETQTSLAETSTLYQLSRYLNEAETLIHVVEAIIKAVAPEATGGQIWISDDQAAGESLTLAADLNSGALRKPLDHLPLIIADHQILEDLRQNQLILINNASEDRRLGPALRDLFQRTQTRSAAWIPLVLRGVWRGLIAIGFDKSRTFSERERRTFTALIDQAGVAIDNRLLLEQTAQALVRNENLYAASRIVNTAQNLQDLVYAAVATGINPDLEYWLSIMEGDLDETGWPTLARVVARSEGNIVRTVDEPHEVNITPDSPLRNGEAVILTDDDPTNPDVSGRTKWLRENGIRFLAIFPLFSANQPIAAFYVASHKPNVFTSEDYESYQAITGQMATQIQNRRLLERTALALAEARRLYSGSRAISSSQTLQSVYQVAAENLAESFIDRLREGGTTLDILVFLAKPDPVWNAPYVEYAYAWSSDLRRDLSDHIGQQIASEQAPFGRFMRGAAARTSSLEKAKQAGIGTFVVNRGIEQTGLALAQILLNNWQEATLIAEEFVRGMGGAGKYLELMGLEADENAQVRSRAYHDVIKGYPGMIRVAQGKANWSQSVAFQETLSTVRVHPDLKGIIAANDVMALGAWEALQSLGLQDVVIVGFDGIPQIIEAIKAGDIHGTVLQPAADMGTLAVDLAHTYLTERTTDQPEIQTVEAVLITQSNVHEFDTLVPSISDLPADRANTGEGLIVAIAQTPDNPFIKGAMDAAEIRAGLLGYETLVLYHNDDPNIQDQHIETAITHGAKAIILDNAGAGGTVYLGNLEHDLTVYPQMQTLLQQDGAASALLIPLYARQQWLGVLVCKSNRPYSFGEQFIRFAQALTDQVAIAVENQGLFQTAESERRQVNSILETMPAGVLVLDPDTYKPIIFNEQAEFYLGRTIDPNEPFSAIYYNMYRTGTHLHYPQDELPIFTVKTTREAVVSDDIAIINNGRQIDLLVNAAPVYREDGSMTAIVASFTDISNLRSLENTLQENLRETVTLYETQRALAESGDMNEVLEVIIIQIMLLQPTDGYVLLADDKSARIEVVRAMTEPPADITPFTALLDNELFVHIHDTHNNKAVSPDNRTVLDQMGFRSLLIVPLRTRTRATATALGWLILAHTEPNAFSEDQERLLITLGDATATAIDNYYLFERTQTSLQQTASLYTATTTISRARDVSDVAQALQVALSALTPDAYAGFLKAPDNQQTRELFKVGAAVDQLDFDVLLELPSPDERGLFLHDIETGLPAGLEKDHPAFGGFRALAVIDLHIQGSTSGRLFVAYTDPHPFPDDEVRYLSAVVDSASVVFDRSQLFDQIQSTLEETSRLYQATRALADATSPDDVITVIVNHLAEEHINQVFVAQLTSRDWNSPGAAVEIVASWNGEGGMNLRGITLTSDQFPAWGQLATPETLIINDMMADDSLDEMTKAGMESLNSRSVIVIPLRAPSRNIGAIWIGSPYPYDYSDGDLRIYQSFSEQASLTLEAAYLLQQTERRARQLETSATVSETAGQILDLDTLLPQLVNLIHDSFEYDHVQIFLSDEEGENAMLRASTGDAGQQLLEIKHSLGVGSDSVIGRVTATGAATIALDTADADVVHRPNPYLPLTRSEMALPLITKGQIVGALDVQSNQPNAFNEEDVRALTTLAGQIAVAIDNANLYAESQRRATDMAFLFDVTAAAAAGETVIEALENVAMRLTSTLDSLSVTIYLPQAYIAPDESTYTVLEAAALSGSNQPMSELVAIHLDESDSVIARVGNSLSAEIIANVRAENKYTPVESEARSAIIVPIVSGSALIGIMVLESRRSRAYDDDILQLLVTLAGSLSAVLQNAQLLEAMQTANEQLRELDRVKSQFLANMSHELRTPLNSIIGFSRVMLKGIDGPLTEMQEQDLTTIFNSGQHLLTLINDILDQAKIASGKMDLKFAYFDVQPLVESVKSIGIGLVKEVPVEMRAEVAPNLPQVYGDEFRTRQILLNLVNNASKFTIKGSITIITYVVEDPETGKTMVRIDVTDTGIGIAEKDMPLLFEAFRQVDSSLTRTAGGTGLGLPISKSLVEMQGGEMIVTSEVNVGSSFCLTIPTEPSVEQPGEESEPEETPAPAAPSANRMKKAEQPARKEPRAVTITSPDARPMTKVVQAKREVLLIEDDKAMVDQFRRALQREGFQVQTADHPMYAEAMVTGMQPTLIVMDVNFAEGAGWDILSRIKNRDDTADIPVIVVTLSEDMDRADEQGAFAFIQRPFMPEQLVEAVLEAEKESNIERILIIDGEAESTEMLTQMLTEHGKYRVFSTDNSIEGMSLVARRRPNLIILDLQLPEPDGLIVLQELQANPETSRIPIIVVTNDDPDDAQQVWLENVPVVYKEDLNAGAFDSFIEHVESHLAERNGGS